jgi:pyruvate dehydrogenase E2 component (dihydrolipoamide acetyltransferase)
MNLEGLDPVTARRRMASKIEELEAKFEELREVGGHPGATDSAAELAQANGLDIRAVAGTGKAGRVLKGDVEAFLEGAHAPAHQEDAED